MTSVAASGTGGISISGSPITSTGTITIGLNLSTAINGLGEGSSPATMNDYAVVQYAGGGTTTTTYHRRKLSNILTKSNIETGLGYARGAANGVAPLNSSSKIDATYLPSYVDDVLEYTAKANFPATGEEGKIYVDKTTNLTWRWGGSAYVEISPSLALGSTASTAAKGNHTHSFTPAGTIAVQTAGTTNNTLKPVTAKTVVVSASGATAAVSNCVLTISNGSFSTGDSVTLGSAVTVKTGDAAYKFTGTAGTTGVPA